jgi:DNA polymerase-3 subunit epsilon
MRPIYYDTETTGVKPKKDKIIEIAAYDPVNQKEFVSLINPFTPIPAEASAIHHITDEMVSKAPSFKEVAFDFIDFCHGDVVLIAHNNDNFDQLFLQAEFESAGIPMPSWRYIDTLKWSRKYRPDLPRHSLQSLRELHQIPANNAHRALDDVIILHQVFTQMIDDLSMETVHKLLSETILLRSMPFGKFKGQPLAEVPKSYLTWLSQSGAFDKVENTDLKRSLEHYKLL